MGIGLKRKQLILAKLESTYGTDASPSPTTDAFEVINPEIRFPNKLVEREIFKQTLSKEGAVVASLSAEITFSVELKSNGSSHNGTAPRVGALLQACNMAESITAESSPGAGDGYVDYTPHSDTVNAKSLTIYYYIDGELYKIVGAVGSWKINGQVGSFPTIDFTFKGKLLSAADSPMPSSVSFEATKPVPFQNVQFTLDGNNSFVCSQLTVDINNTISERPDIQEPDGVKGFFISDRSPNGYIDPERVLRATYDLFGKFKAGTEGSMSAVIGTTPGNIVEITAPAVQYTEFSYGDRDGILTTPVNLRFNGQTGDDEIKLRFR